MKKIVSIILCVFVLFTVCAPACFAEELEFELTIDVNKRYTDISMMEDDPYLSQGSQAEKDEQNKTLYIIILLVLLVISVCVLVFTLKKVPTEKEIEEKDTAEILGTDTDEGKNE